MSLLPHEAQPVEFMLFLWSFFSLVSRSMRDLPELTLRLKQNPELEIDDATDAAAALASPEVADEAKVDFLIALGDKGETAAEIAAFARAFRARAIDPGLSRWSSESIDIVGTGGDHAGGFNISSLVTLTLASLDVKVMKHGNRGITSKCGSADLLAALGFELEASPEQLQQAMRDLGYVFLFAPAFHPAFKYIAPVRRRLAEQGRRSVFNILGPLINPGRPAQVLLGVFSAVWVPRLAAVFDLLGVEAGLAAHGILGGDRGIDELTTATPNRVCGFGRLSAIDGVWQGNEHGFPVASFDDLRGGDLMTNLAIVDATLAGRGPAGLVDTVVLNTATALWICGRVPSIREGAGPAREALLGGAVAGKIADTRAFFGKK